jgi:hypothetical protein
MKTNEFEDLIELLTLCALHPDTALKQTTD